MKRIAHRLVDAHGMVQAQTVLPEHEPFTPAPWMVHKVRAEGWNMVEIPIGDSGLSVHGSVDWRSVCENLVPVVRALLNDGMPISEEEVEQLLDLAQRALDDYDTAVMETTLALGEEDEDGE